MAKAEVGVGTLVIFVASILVASIAVLVLTGTTNSLQSKAFKTASATNQEVSSGIKHVEIFATDGSSGDTVDYIYDSIKLVSGSEPFKFTNDFVLFTISLNNVSEDYIFNGSDVTGESYINCSLDPTTNTGPTSISNSSNDGRYGIEYSLQGDKFTQGFLSDGDVVRVCFKSPRAMELTEEVRLTFIPKTGNAKRIKFIIPRVLGDKRIYLYP